MFYKCTSDGFPFSTIIAVFVGIIVVLGLVGGLIACCVCKSKKAAKKSQLATGIQQGTVITPASV